MKTSFRLLFAAAVFGPLLSSCVVDPYGMPVAGVGYAAPSYSSVGYYNNSGYWGGSYASPYAYPASTSFTYISGGYGRGCSRPVYTAPSCNRPVFVTPSRHYSSGGSPFFGGSHHHRSSIPVTRSAPMPSFQGSHHGAPSSRPSAPSMGSNPFFSHSGSHGGSHGPQPGAISHGHGSSAFAALSSSSGGHHASAPSSSHGAGHHHR